MTKSPEALSKNLGLDFMNMDLLKCALTHRSAGPNNNERLEFLGDSILGFVIANYLYERFPNEREGVLSRMRANLVNQETLADLARGFYLGDYLILGAGELKNGGFKRDSILSDGFEAIIGALSKDQGVETCEKWLLRLFADRLKNLTLNTKIKDPKTLLQELMQSKGLELPVYTLLSQSGSPHDQIFKVECSISIVPEVKVGEGTSRKKAEQQGAEQVLSQIDESFLSDE